MELIETYTGFVELMQFDSNIHTFLVVISVIKCSYLFIIWVLAFLIIVSNGTGSSKIFIFSSILLIITKSGLRNTRCMFQRMMDKILGGIPHCFVYNDDILIASPDAEYHQRHVQQVLTASGSTVSVLTLISMYLQLRK